MTAPYRLPLRWLLPLLLVCLVPGAARSQETILQNDSFAAGQSAGFQSGLVAGEAGAVRLTPPGPFPMTVTGVQFLFGGATGTRTVTLRIWNDSAGTAAPGAEIYSGDFQVTATDNALQEIDLSGSGVQVSGVFRVGIEFQHAGAPSIAGDTKGFITAGRNFIDGMGLGWVDAATLGVTGDWIIRAVVGATYSRNYVQKAYAAYYGRPADPGGQRYWAGRMDAEGQSLNAIIGAFGYSDEFNRRYGGLSFTQLVTKIYQQTLGRDPEQGGLDYYVGELLAGRRTLQSITLDVLNGATTAPDSTVVSNKLDVAAYYTAKVAAGCPYGAEQDGVNSLGGVTAISATVTAAKAAINTRCGP